MPQRFLKPGITSSPKWESCSWQGQSFYIRLLTLVDDFGRYEANPILLRSHAFPLREDIRVDTIERLCSETSAARLVYYYQFCGKRYLQIINWTERTRSDKSYYPSPDAPECSGVYPNSDIPLPIPAERCAPLPPKSPPQPSSSSPSFVQFWAAYPKRIGKGAAEKAFTKAVGPSGASQELLDKILAAVEAQKRSQQWLKDGGQFIPHPSTWLNQKRWEDEHEVSLPFSEVGVKPPVKNVRREPWQIQKDLELVEQQLEKVLDPTRYGYSSPQAKARELAAGGDQKATDDLAIAQRLKQRRDALERELRAL